MKLTLKEFLHEDAREDFIISKQGRALLDAARNDVSARGVHDPAQLLQTIRAMDPTSGKMLQYLVNRYIAGEFRLEDKERVRGALELFVKKRNQLPLRDINQYKSLHDLYASVEETPAPELSKKQQKRQTKMEGAVVEIEGPGISILRLLSGEAACYYAAGTRWCTSNPEIFKTYARSGNIFLILVKDAHGAKRKFQLHYQSGQIMNEKDMEISKEEIELLSQYPEWYEFIDKLTKLHWKKIT